MTDNNTLAQQVTLRISSGDVARIDALTEDVPLKRSALIRAALRLGLAALEEDPTVLLRRSRPAAPAPRPTDSGLVEARSA